MKKMFLISLLISFSVFVNADSNPKDKASLKNNTKPKSAVADTKPEKAVNDTKPKKAVADTKSKKAVADDSSVEYSKVITVHGMVCAFCSNSLEKKLKKEEAIDQVKVNLKNKKVNVLFKKGKSIEDEKLKETIASSGFQVVKIESPSSVADKVIAK